jgi:hypothetical protein
MKKYIIITYSGREMCFECELELIDIGRMINQCIINGETFFSFKELIRYSDIERVILYVEEQQ